MGVHNVLKSEPLKSMHSWLAFWRTCHFALVDNLVVCLESTLLIRAIFLMKTSLPCASYPLIPSYTTVLNFNYT